jgi:hypothetical protein
VKIDRKIDQFKYRDKDLASSCNETGVQLRSRPIEIAKPSMRLRSIQAALLNPDPRWIGR